MGSRTHARGGERHPGRGGRFALLVLGALALGLALAPVAQASFHLMKVREVYPEGDASYVELQMTAAGQYLVSGHHLDTYNADGSLANEFALPSNVSSGSPDNATILIADSGYPAAFPGGPTRDEEDTGLNLSAAGGAVCWTDGSPPDCVAWGNFTGPFPAHVPALVAGSPVSPGGVAAGKAIRRTIAPGCATLLEDSDDSDVSSTDFSEVTPAPRDNASMVTEMSCSGTPPNTAIDDQPPLHSNSQTAEFTYFAAGATSYECKLDTPTFTSCLSTGIEYTGLAEGSHTFQVRGVNGFGPDPTPASYTWSIDLVKPTTTIDTHPPDHSPGASAAFTFHASESATFQCNLEGPKTEPLAGCSSGKTYKNLPDGSYTFKVRATDLAGNVQATPTSFAWTVENTAADTTPPETTITSHPAETIESATATFTYESNEAGSTFECSLDSGAFAACSGTGITYTALALGPHSFQVQAKDPSGNVDKSPAGFSFTVASPPPGEEPPPTTPDTRVTSKPPAKTSDRTPTVKFKASIGGASFQCKLDGKPYAPCRSPLTTKKLAFGRHTIKVRAVVGDTADPTPASVSFRVVKD